jgi:hypothetical protein
MEFKKIQAKVKDFFKSYKEEIILVIGVILISLFSFALGYIVAKQEEKNPIKIEYESSHHWELYYRPLFGLETFREGE